MSGWGKEAALGLARLTITEQARLRSQIQAKAAPAEAAAFADADTYPACHASG